MRWVLRPRYLFVMGGHRHLRIESGFGARRTALVLGVALAHAGCALDSRELLDEAASGGSSGSAGAASFAGASGAGSPPPGWNAPPPPACVYQGDAVDEGCETLVSNPGFDSSVDGWPAQMPSVLVDWSKRDAMDAAESGSLTVDSTLFSEDAQGVVILGAVQCVPVTGGGVYDVRADAFIPEQDVDGAAGVTTLFYKNSSCDAGVAGTDLSYTTPLVTVVGKWTEVSGRFIAPAGVRSMQVELVVGKHFAPRSFKASFDNVLVQPK
jgi:hypothetical protein